MSAERDRLERISVEVLKANMGNEVLRKSIMKTARDMNRDSYKTLAAISVATANDLIDEVDKWTGG